MNTVRVGAVVYLNSRPLVYELEAEPCFSLRLDVPSRCAELLHAGDVDIGLIPAIEYLRGGQPYGIVPGVAVASRGAVASVAVFSKVPVERVRSIALDTSSRTSAALLRVLCAERFGIRPVFRPSAPDLAAMLARDDAALVIGDPALFLDHERLGLLKIDLGAEWTSHTGLPFVWAFWAGRESVLSAAVCETLARVRDRGVNAIEAIARDHSRGDDRLSAQVATYLRQNIHWRLDEPHIAALTRFYDSASRLGLVPAEPVLTFASEGGAHSVTWHS